MDLLSKLQDWRAELDQEMGAGYVSAAMARALLVELQQAIERIEARPLPEECPWCHRSGGDHSMTCIGRLHR